MIFEHNCRDEPEESSHLFLIRGEVQILLANGGLLEMVKLLPIVMQAKAGDKKAMEEIIDLYMPLILKHCKNENLQIDEDCMQYLIINLIYAIKKFRPPVIPADKTFRDIGNIQQRVSQ